MRPQLVRLLPNHFVRVLVFPDSVKDWLTKTIIPGPLREFYLADHRRFDPMATLHFGSNQSLIPTAPASMPRMVLDGEIVALDAQGRSSFQLLQAYDIGQERPPISLLHLRPT